MRFNLIQYTENLYVNYWVIPTIMTLFAILLALGITELAYYVNFPIAFQMNYSKGINILSVIAGATVTMASIVLSITILTLSIASNQLGPRLLPNFMKQGRTQLAIGFLFASFVFAAVSMLIISNPNATTEQIVVLTWLGVILGAGSFFVIIYFIHYVCHVIQIDNLLVYLGNEISHCLDRVLKKVDSKKHIDFDMAETNNTVSKLLKTNVKCSQSGYIQILDVEACLKIARENDLIIELRKHPGNYLWEGQECFLVFHKQTLNEKIKRKLNKTLLLGVRRNTIQDIEFAVEQLSEIAIRALSPSMANPFTAINCIDRLAFAINTLNGHQEEPNLIYDADKHLRIIRNYSTFANVVDAAFSRLRQQSRTDVLVNKHLLQSFYELLKNQMQPELANALRAQAQALMDALPMTELSNFDKDCLDRLYKTILTL